MKLSDYLDEAGLSPTEFADKIGVSQPAVARYLNGKRRPEWDVLQRIARVTKGKVQPNDFIKIKIEAA